MPDPLSTDVLTSQQLVFIAERLPEPRHAPTGRPAYSNRDLLLGSTDAKLCDAMRYLNPEKAEVNRPGCSESIHLDPCREER